MHHTQHKRRIRSRQDRNEPICPAPCLTFMDINDNNLGSIFSSFFGQHDLMHIRANGINTPHNNKLRIDRFLRVGAIAAAHRITVSFGSSSTTDRI
ncbi:hypothetical protein D3C73_1026340 [compost metagenome]